MKLKTFLLSVVVIMLLGLLVRTLSKRAEQPTSSAPVPVATMTPTPERNPGRALKSGEEFISPLGLYIVVPEGMTFRKEIADDAGVIRSVGFYIEKDDEYKLYGLYQQKSLTERGLEEAKKEMDAQTIKEATVGGYKGVEGLITGPRGRYNTIVVKDGKTLSFSTIPATEENKTITDQILSTVSFE